MPFSQLLNLAVIRTQAPPLLRSRGRFTQFGPLPAAPPRVKPKRIHERCRRQRLRLTLRSKHDIEIDCKKPDDVVKLLRLDAAAEVAFRMRRCLPDPEVCRQNLTGRDRQKKLAAHCVPSITSANRLVARNQESPAWRRRREIPP